MFIQPTIDLLFGSLMLGRITFTPKATRTRAHSGLDWDWTVSLWCPLRWRPSVVGHVRGGFFNRDGRQIDVFTSVWPSVQHSTRRQMRTGLEPIIGPLQQVRSNKRFWQHNFSTAHSCSWIKRFVCIIHPWNVHMSANLAKQRSGRFGLKTAQLFW